MLNYIGAEAYNEMHQLHRIRSSFPSVLKKGLAVRGGVDTVSSSCALLADWEVTPAVEKISCVEEGKERERGGTTFPEDNPRVYTMLPASAG